MFLAFAFAAAHGCAGAGLPPRSGNVPSADATAVATGGAVPVPAGYGTLRQDDIAIRIQLQGVQVKAIPLDESVIRVLSPDSYRALRDLVESRRDEINVLASRRGLREPSLWYVSYFGLEPEARFSPTDVVITSAGRDHRPVEIIPLSTGFGQHRLRQREVQSAIYLFDDALEVEQPLVVTIETSRDESWAQTLRRVERERALIRSRTPRAPATP